MNTKYFQLLTNGKHRKTRIFQLQDRDRTIEGDEPLKNTSPHTTKGSLASPLKIISD
jgi:hypothetical protein